MYIYIYMYICICMYTYSLTCECIVLHRYMKTRSLLGCGDEPISNFPTQNGFKPFFLIGKPQCEPWVCHTCGCIHTHT